MTKELAVETTNLRKSYKGRAVVDGISLGIEKGTTYGILGPNGAGKTTTVEMIGGLRKPDSGAVSVLGLHPVRERARLRQVLGIQLQSALLHDALTAKELVDLYRSFYPNPRSVEETLGLVHLSEQRNTRFQKLSGGQQQRLSVALALVGRPEVVILDEITTGLDPTARRRIWATLETLHDDGVTVLMVSHAMDEVERLCDRVALIKDGRVLIEDTPAGITESAGAENLEEAFVSLTGTEIYEGEAA
ncbi:MAG TPA: ABC transporter ATP-binding protein [Candidatus Agrococcus pullicola]|uniref:ABC transporter ATP-binding protein n=1 Tax=Candidatus Agrococcus pullicola TaxID=2838429 RepID=A0A9D2C953_9MICO|nr:ABC transporter ATP-binding protein [Candidatus Agrococcus pullicola]